MSDTKETIANPLEKVQSHDWNKERLEQLKQLMPDLFTNEGKLNLNELKKVVDPESVSETERYEFRWFGKSKAKREAFTPTNATLVYDEERSVNPENSENLIIEGENLQVLKLLSNSYREQVKCIYIDPPYNTGKDFVYSDKFNQNRKEYWEDSEMTENGIKVDTNAETDGRFHSNWLNMMYSRLLMARQLLREDGVIFISIDDNEVHHLRKLCDEVFGEENFVSSIIWQKKYSVSNDDPGIAAMHDYILCFQKSEKFHRNLLPRTEKQLLRYKNPDDDFRGPWASAEYVSSKTKEERPTLYYPILHPKTKKEVWPDESAVWRYSKDKHQNIVKENRLYWGQDFNYEKPRLKRFLSEIQGGLVPGTWWSFKEVGHNDEGQKETAKILGRKIFSTPKPVRLIEKILRIACSNEDLVLDFFSGSGTIAQAVTKLNQEDGGNRKYILVQLPEATDEKSEAFKSGYKKISDITIERNKRVIQNIIAEKKNETLDIFSKKEDEKDQLKGLGFKVFKLVKSNFPRVDYAPDPEKSDEENVALLKKYIAEKEAQLVSAFNREELITEILIKNGFKLNYSLEKQEQFKQNEIFLASDGDKETLICLDVSLADETVAHFKTHTGQKMIVLERALDTTKKWNLKHFLGDKFSAF
ncbi:site-specific DNA-methyltransferase [Antarcticibacterium flavum]|uniref:site-specific DNA-methyltransferase (adenine-specific) n=1 Tax=Antarcticibacterium flavum TaxID=2058175 RepID=A0A5B7X472_9FLAO|nr:MULTISPECIES: site-specific DNA-methyltransferase [Antarcticibacterium]MCM4158441.1 site-specific DNA-methyltransferase [Antarcticibacterium sp. W02-3]QCY70197.1 site-specific DNA-methyltransferase [Antarcticibacterium flavum]